MLMRPLRIRAKALTDEYLTENLEVKRAAAQLVPRALLASKSGN